MPIAVKNAKRSPTVNGRYGTAQFHDHIANIYNQLFG